MTDCAAKDRPTVNYDLLLHLDMDHQDILDLALGNAANYLAALPGQTPRVVLLANAGAVKLFQKRNIDPAAAVAGLREKGVRFLVCANAMRKFGVAPEDLMAACATVPAGIVALVELQREGYAYVKP